MAYGFAIFLAVVICLLAAENLTRNRNLSLEIFWECAFWTIIFGIIGARLYHVIDYWNLYSQFPTSIFFIWNGGLGIFGALVFGALTSGVFLFRKRQNLFQWFDVFFTVLPLGQAIGRWGNYFNNELLPYALYESLVDLLLFAILISFHRKKLKSGSITFFYLLGYSTIRFLLEPLRTNPWQIAQINVAQTISVILGFVGIIGLWKLRQKN